MIAEKDFKPKPVIQTVIQDEKIAQMIADNQQEWAAVRISGKPLARTDRFYGRYDYRI
jgi:hypothetical protein